MGSFAHQWHLENPDSKGPEFNAKTVPAKKPSHLPKQNNYCDCGLFTLTYMHFFSNTPPDRIRMDSLDKLGGNAQACLPYLPCRRCVFDHAFRNGARQAGLALTVTSRTAEGQQISTCPKESRAGVERACLCADDEANFPLILTRQWFTPENAGNLRRWLRHMILDMFVAQASDRECGPLQEAIVERDELAKDFSSKYLLPVCKNTPLLQSCCLSLSEKQTAPATSQNVLLEGSQKARRDHCKSLYACILLKILQHDLTLRLFQSDLAYAQVVTQSPIACRYMNPHQLLNDNDRRRRELREVRALPFASSLQMRWSVCQEAACTLWWQCCCCVSSR